VKINRKDFLNLKTLLIEGSITFGKFVNKEIITQLKSNGAIKIDGTPKRKIVHLLKSENIFLFLKNSSYNINSLEDIESFVEEVIETQAPRDTIQKWRTNGKRDKSESLKGLYVSSLTDTTIRVDDKEFIVLPTNGVGYFLFHTQKIEVSPETIIVGVENYQVIWFAQKYQQFFDKNVLFVYTSPYMFKWIEDLENEYIHFGDYDLAGINIYLNTIVPRLKKCKKHSMFIPENIEYLIKEHGDEELYEQQTRYKNLVVNDREISTLKNIICKYKKSLEQEGLSLL